MQFNNTQNLVPSRFNGSYTDLLKSVDKPADMAELDEIGEGFDLGAVLSTSLGLSPVAPDLTAQSPQSAQVTSAQSASTASMVQMTSANQFIPMIQTSPLTQLASMVLPAPTLQMLQMTPLTHLASPKLLAFPMMPSTLISQPIPTAQAIPQVLLDQSAQA